MDAIAVDFDIVHQERLDHVGSESEDTVDDDRDASVGEVDLVVTADVEDSSRGLDTDESSSESDSSDFFLRSMGAPHIDPVKPFTSGIFATSRSDSGSPGSSVDESYGPSASPLVERSRRESSLSTSSESSTASLAMERAGIVMAEHLDTFSGNFTRENYRSATAFVGHRQHQDSSGPGVVGRMVEFVGRLADSSDGAIGAHGSVRSRGELTAGSSVSTQQGGGGSVSAEQRGNEAVPAVQDSNAMLSTPSSTSSSSSSSQSEDGGTEQFVTYATNIDHPNLSSHPALVLPAGSKAIGVIGRDFDEPLAVVSQLVHGLRLDVPPWNTIFFQPMVIPSKDLNRTDCRQYLEQGNFHMLIMCYNTTETRLMLTSPTGGYYKYVLPYAQRTYGDNKAVFVLTRHATADADIVHPTLADRLQPQPLLKEVFDRQLVFSWNEQASPVQKDHFLSLVQAEAVIGNQECVIL